MIEPIGNNLIVKLEEKQEQTTSSGIILRDNTKASALGKGAVVAEGDLVDLPVCEAVYFSKYKGIRFDRDGVNYALLKKDDILGFE